MNFYGQPESLDELSWYLRRLINRMADYALADIALMAARARGEHPRFWRGMPLG